MRKYRISASLLNAFNQWLNSDEIFDTYWGESEQPAMTRDEFHAKQLAELLAYINHEPQPPNEAAERGTALNDIIDIMNFGRKVDTELFVANTFYVARRCGFTFAFDRDFVDSLCLVFRTAVAQHHLSCQIPFGGGVVELHGYPDYIFPTMIWDLKTTSRYSQGKYADNWQRLVYPYAAITTGVLTGCENFTFYALECRADMDGIITGKPFTETYDFNYYEASVRIREFIDTHVIPSLDEWQRCDIIRNQTIISHEE